MQLINRSNNFENAVNQKIKMHVHIAKLFHAKCENNFLEIGEN